LWKHDYFKYLFSKKTIFILCILLILSCISYFFSLSDKNMLISQLSDTSPDLNVQDLEILIAQYTGFKFLFDSWFLSDLYFLNLFILYTWVGVYLVPQLQIEKEKGYGNLLAIRL
jgi:hypothetical protein